jgi:hypothetical protein
MTLAMTAVLQFPNSTHSTFLANDVALLGLPSWGLNKRGIGADRRERVEGGLVVQEGNIRKGRDWVGEEDEDE